MARQPKFLRLVKPARDEVDSGVEDGPAVSELMESLEDHDARRERTMGSQRASVLRTMRLGVPLDGRGLTQLLQPILMAAALAVVASIYTTRQADQIDSADRQSPDPAEPTAIVKVNPDTGESDSFWVLPGQEVTWTPPEHWMGSDSNSPEKSAE